MKRFPRLVWDSPSGVVVLDQIFDRSGEEPMPDDKIKALLGQAACA